MAINVRGWLKKARNDKGLTQQQTADAARISRSYYTQIELGIKTPPVVTAVKIADALDFEWIIFFEVECSLKEQKQLA